jgi:hypothetical protein
VWAWSRRLEQLRFLTMVHRGSKVTEVAEAEGT